MEFLLQEFAGWQSGEVFGDVDAAWVEFEQFDLFRLFPGAEDDAEGRVFTGLLLVFGEPAEVEFHLAFVFGFEVAQFQIDGDEAFQAAMVEKEIEVEVVGINLDARLTTKKGKAVAKFEEECFEFAQDGVFEVFFEVAILEAWKSRM